MKSISHIYDSYANAHDAVLDLEKAGVDSANISIIAGKEIARAHSEVHEPPASATGTGAGIGAAAGGTVGLLAGLGLLAIPGLGPVVAAGWLAAAAVGAVAGGAAGASGGALIGALRETGMPEENAQLYFDSIKRGGTLVTARVPDSQWDMACAILERHNPIDPYLRGDGYRDEVYRDPRGLTESQVDRIRNSGYL